jgi:transglutaminase-like putative cysteine protease
MPGPGNGALGALNPGKRTDVGGSPGAEGGSSNSLGELSRSVHFTVESRQPSYWRTGAYGTYTGSGWKRLANAPSAPVLPDGRNVAQRVQLQLSAGSLPTAWKPRSVDVLNRTGKTPYRTPRSSYRVDGGLPEGTVYEAVSRVRESTPTELRTSGTDYPSGIESYYTDLQGSTTDRLGAFTDDLTRNASNAYETARMVEVWLERNKRYSLNASHDTDRPLVDQFVFEMEKGYCEYFATAMTVMLRTQDVPARYVVGYAPGRENGSNRYTVRGTDAHAWVEVYFPDEGWVRFDPTPAATRRSQERRNVSPGDVERRPIVEGSPGDANATDSLPPMPGNGTNVSPDVPEVTPDRIPAPPYEVKLTETPVPGKEVTAKVTKAGRPVEGIVVTFNGDPVGETDRNGEVVGTVPYESDLTVRARSPETGDGDDDTVMADLSLPAGNDETESPDPTPPPAERGPAKLSAGTGPESPTLATAGREDPQFGSQEDDDDSERTYDLTTDVSLSVRGVLAPGRETVLVTTIDEVPVADARVTFAGDVVGYTDENGRISVTVTESEMGSVAVGIERDSVSDRVTLSLAEMNVELVPDTVVPLPGQGATVKVTVGETAVSGVPVTVDGRRVGTTDRQGRVAVALPVDGDVRIRAEGPVLSRTVTVSGLFLNLGVAIVAVVGVLVGIVLGVRRYGPDAEMGAGTVRNVLERIGAWVAVLPGAVASRLRVATIVSGRYLGVALAGAIDLARRAVSRIRSVSYTGAVRTALGRVRRGVVGLVRWILAIPARVVGGLVGVLNRGESASTAPGGRGTGDGENGSSRGGSGMTIRAAWRWFVRTLGLRTPETMTPGEMRRRAVEMGFPEKPVSRLTDAFRDVEYGGREPTDNLRDRARDAVRRVKRDERKERDRGRRPRGDS